MPLIRYSLVQNIGFGNLVGMLDYEDVHGQIIDISNIRGFTVWSAKDRRARL